MCKQYNNLWISNEPVDIHLGHRLNTKHPISFFLYLFCYVSGQILDDGRCMLMKQ